jgi:hypothetical protein
MSHADTNTDPGLGQTETYAKLNWVITTQTQIDLFQVNKFVSLFRIKLK